MNKHGESSDTERRLSPFPKQSYVRFPRNSGNFSRRPAFSQRRRWMSGRYPNRGFRPFEPRTPRPNCPSPLRGSVPDFRIHYPPISTTGVVLPGTPRPPFPCAALNNASLSSPKPAADMNYKESQSPMEVSTQTHQLMEANMSSELWIEALAPGERKYYFNARTRKTVWDKPVNARVIDLEEINRLTPCSGREGPQNRFNQNPNKFVKQAHQLHQPPQQYQLHQPLQQHQLHQPLQQHHLHQPRPPQLHQPQQLHQPFNLFNDPFNQGNFSMPVRYMVFPPPQNVCNPIIPQMFTVPPPNIQDTTSCGYSAMVRPSLFPIIAQNSMSISNTSDCNETAVDHTGELKKDPGTVIKEEEECNQSKMSDFGNSESAMTICSAATVSECNAGTVLDWSMSESAIPDEYATSFSTSTANETSTSEAMDESSMQQGVINPNEIKTEKGIVQSPKPEHSPATETKNELTKEPVASENKEQQVDKSRPVCSTPVPGTLWNIVWTGDEKVFFFDSVNKASVWDRPVELIGRADVDKLVEKPPSSVNLNSEKKEVRKTTSDGSEVIKKLKKEKNEDVNQELDENFGDKMIITDDKDLKKNETPKSDDIPHEQKVEIFRKMLADNKVSPFSTWEKELHKIVYDPRYLLLPSKERRRVFDSYMAKKLEEEQKERQKEYQRQKENFVALMEEAGINSKSEFRHFSQCYGRDVRFKSVEKPKQRENIFNNYVSELIKKDRESEKLKADQKKHFIELLSEKDVFRKENITWAEVQKWISNDGRYKAIQSDHLREKIFKECIRGRKTSNLFPNSKEERVSASLKNREEEVKRDLSVHLQNREKEQEDHKRKLAYTNFKALLNDLIKCPSISWHSAKKTLKQDQRWDLLAECLELDRREELFEQHIESLVSKKKQQFHRLLDELPNIHLKSSWLDVRKSVLKDPRCIKFSSSERKCEREFKDYLRLKSVSAKHDFKELLNETKLINYKSKCLLNEANYLKELEEILSQDKRFLNLDCMRTERRKILLSHIDDLYKKGPPPHPAASEPSNRRKFK